MFFVYYLKKGNKRRAICEFIAAIEWRNQERAAAFDKKKVFFYQDNASVHTSVITMVKINQLKLELLLHAHYSPDLVCCGEIQIFFQLFCVFFVLLLINLIVKFLQLLMKLVVAKVNVLDRTIKKFICLNIGFNNIVVSLNYHGNLLGNV